MNSWGFWRPKQKNGQDGYAKDVDPEPWPVNDSPEWMAWYGRKTAALAGGEHLTEETGENG